MSYLSRFHSQITGPDSAPKLVFLHGAMGYAANWRRIVKAFEDRFQILVYDQRGHGRSFHPPSGYAASNYAEDLELILDELGWLDIDLIGHSMGGRAALVFASRHPRRVTRLVIEDIGPAMQVSASSFILRVLDAVPVPFASRREAKLWFDTKFMELFANERHKEGLAAFFYANITENEQKQAVWRFYEPGIRESVADGRALEHWDEIRNLAMPTLLIRGALSSDLPKSIYDEVLRFNPRIQGVEIEGAGHWVHSDKPEEFIAVLQRFLEAGASG